MNFWNELKRPILCLAPMADVTDAAFRYIIAKYSKEPAKTSLSLPVASQISLQRVFAGSYVTYTEFVSADGLVLAPESGKKKLLKNLEFDEIERPIVVQIFGSKPENIYKAVQMIMELESASDGIDINMGCPDRSVEKQGAGAALIKNPKLAQEIIVATKNGIKEAAKKLNREEIPVSVKTRIGYNKNELETWLPNLLKAQPAAVIIHARTRKQMSKVPANWDYIKRAVEIRNEINKKILIIGNGNVANVTDAYKKCEETRADGAMIGRGVFGNPWLFADHVPTAQEKIRVLIEHIKIFDQKLSGFKSFDLMKKHFKSYLSGIPDTKKLKEELMQTKKAEEAIKLLQDFHLS